MIYLLVFILCFIIESYNNKNKIISTLCIYIVYLILCFGYTTGTDWPNYELYFNNEIYNTHFGEREPGLGILTTLCKYIISDFWLFNGLCKVFYLYSLTLLTSCFIKNKWTAIGFSLLFSSLFIIVNCPMRFMLATAFINVSASQLLNKKYLLSTIFGIIAFFFHITIIIPILFFATGFLYDKFYQLRKTILIILTIVFLIISNFIGIYQFIFSNVLSFIGLNIFSDSTYSIFNNNSIFSIGTLRNLLLLLFIIKYKELFSDTKSSRLIFFYAVTYFWMDVLFRPIPTAFRLSIFNSIMASVAIAYLISKKNCNYIIVPKFYRYAIVTVFSLLILKTAYGSYVYYPYTNSIPYILFGHMNYSERVVYNKVKYFESFGYSNTEENSNSKGQKLD